MFKKNRLFMLFCVLVVFGFYGPINAFAKTYTLSRGSHLFFDKNGKITTSDKACKYSGGDCRTVWKKFKDFVHVDPITGKKEKPKTKWAYCSQFPKGLPDNLKFEKAPTNQKWNEEKRLIAGKCIQLVNEKYAGKNDERYLYGAMLMNYVFKYAASSKVNGIIQKNTELMKFYETAVKEVRENQKQKCYNTNTKLPAVNIADVSGTRVLKTKGSNAYVSNAIKISGLQVGKFCGENVTYTLSAKNNGTANGTVTFCDDAAGTKNCTATKTVSGVDSVNYYVNVSYPSAVTASGKVDLIVSGKSRNTVVYPYVEEYRATSNASAKQNLELYFEAKVPYSVSKNLSLDFPGTSLSIYKADEEGNPVEGAELEIYTADDENGTQNKNVLSMTLGSNGTSWTNSQALIVGKYYCINEKKSPVGYVLQEPITCRKYEKKDSELCSDPSGEIVGDSSDDSKKEGLNYCGAHWDCENDSGELITVGESKKCTKLDSSTATAPSICGEGYTLTDGRCLKDTTADAVDGVCSDGSSPTNEEGAPLVCTSAVLPTCDTANGFEMSGDTCVKRVTTDATCIGGKGVKDNKFCDGKVYDSIVQTGNSFSITRLNKKTSVSISKKDATGEEEVPGAYLKICDTKPDADGSCTPITLRQKGLQCPETSVPSDEEASNDSGSSSENNSDNNSSDDNSSDDDSSSNSVTCTYDETTNTRTVSVAWVSSTVPVTWNGLETGKTYYIVEDTPPSGYISVTTSTEFTILENGNVKIGKKELLYDKDVAVINNQLSKVSISKADIATSKEIPGATLSICEANVDSNGNWSLVKDEYGDCSLAVLQDGTAATWKSTNSPHDVIGLPIGNYYLVEDIAPNGYSTAEAIPFSLKKDGTLTDKDGKSLKDSKITMHDKPIKDVKTGSLGVHIVFAILLFASICGVGSYFFLKNKSNQTV